MLWRKKRRFNMLPKGYMLRGVELINYTVIEEFQMDTLDTYLYGRAPTAGRNDRVAWIIEVSIGDREAFVIYDECFYHYECTRNSFGDNLVYIGENFIRIPSDTTDYEYVVFTSYEDALEYIRSQEDYGYVVK
jgi:hypothetical protein